MQQTDCSQELAGVVYKNQNGDIVDSIMIIHKLQEKNEVGIYLETNMPTISEENEEEMQINVEEVKVEEVKVEEIKEEEMQINVEEVKVEEVKVAEIKEEVKQDIQSKQPTSAKNKIQAFKEKRKSA